MEISTFALRPIAAALVSVLVLQGCATQNSKGEKVSMGESLKQTFDSDDPCSIANEMLAFLPAQLLVA